MRRSVIAVKGLNPEPWEPSRASMGWRGKKPYVQHHKPEKLGLFQAALSEALDACAEAEPWVPEPGEFLLVHFWLYRSLEASTRQSGRRHRGHVADATNMQKAIEDACQGYLFGNDRDNRHVATTITEQRADITPAIVIERIMATVLPEPPTVDDDFDALIDLTDQWEGNDVSNAHEVPDDVF